MGCLRIRVKKTMVEPSCGPSKGSLLFTTEKTSERESGRSWTLTNAGAVEGQRKQGDRTEEPASDSIS